MKEMSKKVRSSFEWNHRLNNHQLAPQSDKYHLPRGENEDEHEQ